MPHLALTSPAHHAASVDHLCSDASVRGHGTCREVAARGICQRGVSAFVCLVRAQALKPAGRGPPTPTMDEAWSADAGRKYSQHLRSTLSLALPKRSNRVLYRVLTEGTRVADRSRVLDALNRVHPCCRLSQFPGSRCSTMRLSVSNSLPRWLGTTPASVHEYSPKAPESHQ